MSEYEELLRLQSTLEEQKVPHEPMSDKTKALLSTLPKDRMTVADFTSAVKVGLAKYAKRIKDPQISRLANVIQPTFKVKNNNDAVFRDPYHLMIHAGDLYIPYFGDDISDYEYALDAYYHTPTEQEINKVMTLKFNKSIPKAFKEEIVKTKRGVEIPTSILFEENPVINRIMHACGSSKKLMILASIYLINPESRLPVLCKLTGLNPGASLINTLTYVQPIDALKS